MKSLKQRKVWILEVLSQDKKTIRCKWVFKKKFKVDGIVNRYKEKLVSKGYSQVQGTDCQEYFSHVAKMTSIDTLLNLSIASDL